MTARAAVPDRPDAAQAPPRFDRATCTRDQALDVIDMLLDEVELLRQLADRMYRQGRADLRAEQDQHGYRCIGHAHAIADAILEGQRIAHADGLDDFTAGVEACWRRFAAEIGSRSFPPSQRYRRDRPMSPRRLKASIAEWQAGWPDRVAAARASWGLPS